MPIPAMTRRIEGETFSRLAATATAASSASMKSSVCTTAAIAHQPGLIRLETMFTVSASTETLKKNDSTPCKLTTRRITLLVIATSDTCEVIAMTKEK